MGLSLPFSPLLSPLPSPLLVVASLPQCPRVRGLGSSRPGYLPSHVRMCFCRASQVPLFEFIMRPHLTAVALIRVGALSGRMLLIGDEDGI